MIIIILILLIGCMFYFFIKLKNMLSFWMLALYIGCFFVVLGYMYYYAKNGGVSKDVYILLFLHKNIMDYLMYSPIPLDKLSMFIVMGRSIFIYSNLCFGIKVYFNKNIKDNKKWYALVSIFPIIHTIWYYPSLYRKFFVHRYHLINNISRIFIVIYTVISIILIYMKYKKINIPYFKKQLKYILAAVLSINVLFYLFGFFGTMQISDPNTLGYLYSTFAMLQSSVALLPWYVIISVAVLFIGIGFVFLWNYSKIEEQIGKPDLFLERKLKTAHMGARIFTHGIKNQLLSTRVLLRRTRNLINNESIEIEKIEKNINALEQLNEQMLARMDVLYRTFKSNTMQLKPISVRQAIKSALNKTGEFPEDVFFLVKDFEDKIVLGDIAHLTEALYNIIKNSIDAIKAKNSNELGKLIIDCHFESTWCVIEIVDNGIGIEKNKINKIFDPFYTNKNTNYNWGIGLSYAQQIIKSQFGYIRTESEVNVGTTFFIFLPIYKTDKKMSEPKF
ncbi:hypothetical protein SH1V18_43630 [Vallitalea longa]|uniref:histidine kinase n=1 Tax=Vallitalea longa TaxID=2936439 RepID=A0A9W5YGI5_9FIRM|nr:HAMP domain-containing sensor histidine kinase [Vallitalea longa]GKX31883.1 hypothetical protein SH1V18_43630 [Vallitalea longa]